jgi:hypothetical protein
MEYNWTPVSSPLGLKANNLLVIKVLPAMVNALLRINFLREIDIWQYFFQGTKNTVTSKE